jgi:hypothetical protein
MSRISKHEPTTATYFLRIARQKKAIEIMESDAKRGLRSCAMTRLQNLIRLHQSLLRSILALHSSFRQLLIDSLQYERDSEIC